MLSCATSFWQYTVTTLLFCEGYLEAALCNIILTVYCDCSTFLWRPSRSCLVQHHFDSILWLLYLSVKAFTKLPCATSFWQYTMPCATSFWQYTVTALCNIILTVYCNCLSVKAITKLSCATSFWQYTVTALPFSEGSHEAALCNIILTVYCDCSAFLWRLSRSCLVQHHSDSIL